MISEWTLLAHSNFIQKRDKLISADKSLSAKFPKRIDFIREYPENTQNRIQGLSEDIAGRVYKVKVGGSSGYNIYYLTFPKNRLCLIMTVYLKKRKDTDYRYDIPIDEFYEAINDFENGTKEKFEYL
ncbi:MAG: hypothetical protein JW908_04290 [Anaerolineales bacterium]|nr:hypothetical protein [Anaerolineales bacterium]